MVGIPVSAEIRQARGDAARAVGPAMRVLRGPVLSLLGAGGVTVDGLTALNNWGRRRPRTATLGASPSRDVPVSRSAWLTYGGLVERGEDKLHRISAHPEVAGALRRGHEVTTVWNKRVESVADELNDLSEETLARLELRIRGVSETFVRHRRGPGTPGVRPNPI